MIEYRIVEKEYHDGSIKFAVEKSVDHSDWESVFHTDKLDKAREVLAERRSKTTPVKTKVIE